MQRKIDKGKISQEYRKCDIFNFEFGVLPEFSYRISKFLMHISIHAFQIIGIENILSLLLFININNVIKNSQGNSLEIHIRILIYLK